jgi:hypothetical protein
MKPEVGIFPIASANSSGMSVNRAGIRPPKGVPPTWLVTLITRGPTVTEILAGYGLGGTRRAQITDSPVRRETVFHYTFPE